MFFFFRKVPKTGEMLNMLNLLGFKGPISPHRFNIFNIFNISPVLSIFQKKKNIWHFPCFVKVDSRNRGNVKCFFRKVLRTGEMLNMLNVPPSIPFLNPCVAFYNDFQKENNEKPPTYTWSFSKTPKTGWKHYFCKAFFRKSTISAETALFLDRPEKGTVNLLSLFFGRFYYKTGEKWHFGQKGGSQIGPTLHQKNVKSCLVNLIASTLRQQLRVKLFPSI